MPKPSRIYPDEPSPEDIPTHVNKLWEDDPVTAPIDPIVEQIKEKVSAKSPTPILAPNKAAPGSLSKGPTEPAIAVALDHALDVAEKSKVGRKPTGSAMTNSERQAKWRAANREIALARQRDAMKKIRQKIVE